MVQFRRAKSQPDAFIADHQGLRLIVHPTVSGKWCYRICRDGRILTANGREDTPEQAQQMAIDSLQRFIR